MKQLREWGICVVIAFGLVLVIRPCFAQAYLFNSIANPTQEIFKVGDKVLFDKISMPTVNDFDSYVWSKGKMIGKPVFRFWPINRIGFIKKEK